VLTLLVIPALYPWFAGAAELEREGEATRPGAGS
jgi:hypothetical protein